MGLGRMGDEELAAIGAGSGIRHGKHARLVAQRVALELVREGVTGTAAAGACGVATLNHEVRDDAVKGYAIVIAFVGKEDEVVDGIGSIAREEIQDDVAFGCLQRNFVNLGRVKAMLGHKAEAISYLKDGLARAIKHENMEVQKEASLWLYKIQKEGGNCCAALMSFESFHSKLLQPA